MSISSSFLADLEIDLSLSTMADPAVDDDLTMASDFESPKGNSKIQHCIVTLFPESCDPKWLLPNTYFLDTSIIENWCGQFEVASSTDAIHAHIYINFVNSKKPRFNSIRKAFMEVLGKGVNIKLNKHRFSNKSQACSVNYVLAPDKRAPETEPFIWQHNKKQLSFDESLWKERTEGKQQSRSKEDRDKEIVDYIESKPKHWTWEQIVHESYESKLLLASCSWGSKFHAGRHAEAPRRLISNVVVLYGAGGTGKTTIAQKWDARDDEDFVERYYKRNYDDGKFWGGSRTAYKCQRIVHLEEFCGQETCAKFKELCDIGKQGPSVNIKNGGIDLNHDTIIVTSNHHPAAWYRQVCSKDQKQWLPIARRFTQVWFFPEHRPDGSLNVPDADHPPYYVDQTDDFLSMIHSYEDAVEHAKQYWKIPDSMPMSDDFNPAESSVNEFYSYCQTGRKASRS